MTSMHRTPRNPNRCQLAARSFTPSNMAPPQPPTAHWHTRNQPPVTAFYNSKSLTLGFVASPVGWVPANIQNFNSIPICYLGSKCTCKTDGAAFEIRYWEAGEYVEAKWNKSSKNLQTQKALADCLHSLGKRLETLRPRA